MPMVIIPRWTRLIHSDVHPINDEGRFVMFGRHVEEVSQACIYRGVWRVTSDGTDGRCMSRVG